MKPIGTKPIRTKRLILRAPQMQDAEALVRIKSLAMPLEEAHQAVAGMIEELRKPFAFHWVITLDGTVVGRTLDGTVVGRVKAWDINPYNGYLQLGYDVGPGYRKQGYMTEAVSAVIRYLMNEAEVNRVFCSVREGNLASCRVCEKCGMRHEGTLRQHYARQDGGYDDIRIYGILKSEITVRDT